MKFINRAGQLWDIDLSGTGADPKRVVVIETISPPNDGPGALRFINHRCVIQPWDEAPAIIRNMGFELVFVEDLENPWDSKRRPVASPNPPPLYVRIA